MNGSVCPREAHSDIVDVDTEMLRTIRGFTRLDPTIRIDTIMTTFTAYPEEVRRAILRHLNEAVPSPVLYFIQESEWTAAMFSEYFAYQHELGNSDPERFLTGLHCYPQLPEVEDYTTTNQRTQQQVKALLTVTRELVAKQTEISRYNVMDPRLKELPLEYPDASGVKLKGDALIKLVLAHTEQADLITDIILERWTGDADLIRSILTSDSPAVSEGTL
jgi:hypothetical protein